MTLEIHECAHEIDSLLLYPFSVVLFFIFARFDSGIRMEFVCTVSKVGAIFKAAVFFCQEEFMGVLVEKSGSALSFFHLNRKKNCKIQTFL